MAERNKSLSQNIETYINAHKENSRKMYKHWMIDFQQFVSKTSDPNNHSQNLLEYFNLLHGTYVTSTIWSISSVIKQYMLIQYKVDVDMEVPLLKAMFKNWQKSEEKKKSKVFSKQDLEKFFSDAEDDWKNLQRKIVAMLGILGLLRKSELVALEWKDVSINEVGLQVVVKRKKQLGNLHRTEFIIPKTANIGKVNLCELWNKYCSCFNKEAQNGRLLRRITKSLQGSKQNVGVHTIGSVPKEIAEFLQLRNPNEYTSHCMRRTGATLMADNGADTLAIMRAGGWQSRTVAEGYVAESQASKIEIANTIISSCKVSKSTEEKKEEKHTEELNENENAKTIINTPININNPQQAVNINIFVPYHRPQ